MKEYCVVGGFKVRADAILAAAKLAQIGYVIVGVFQDDAGWHRIQIVRD